MKTLLFLLMFFTVPAEASQEHFFLCQKTVDNVPVYFLAYEVNGAYVGHLSNGHGQMNVSPKFSVLGASEAQKNPFVMELAKALKFTQSQIDHVELFEVGNFAEERNGALGVNFFNSVKTFLGRGMFIGWSGPQDCNEYAKP